MKQEGRLQGSKAKAGFVSPLLWLCLSFPWVLPSDFCLEWSLLRLGCWPKDPGMDRTQRGTEQPESSVAAAEGRGLHTRILHKSPDSPCAPRTILQWIILHNLISLRVWGLHPGVFPQGRTICRLFPLALLFKGGW